jgi:hypothetical protein
MPGFSAGVLRGSRAWSEPDKIFFVDACSAIIALYAWIGLMATRIRRAKALESGVPAHPRLQHSLPAFCPGRNKGSMHCGISNNRFFWASPAAWAPASDAVISSKL